MGLRPLHHPGRALATVALLALLTACGGSDDSARSPGVPEPDPTEDPSDDDPTGDQGAGGALDPSLDTEVAAALALLGGTGVEVVSAERVTWPDGALGCPQPDMTYTQALVEGYRIVLSTPDGQVQVHGQDGGEPFVCDDPQPAVG